MMAEGKVQQMSYPVMGEPLHTSPTSKKMNRARENGEVFSMSASDFGSRRTPPDNSPPALVQQAIFAAQQVNAESMSKVQQYRTVPIPDSPMEPTPGNSRGGQSSSSDDKSVKKWGKILCPRIRRRSGWRNFKKQK